MTIESKVIDLLIWIKEGGVFPARPSRNDRFINIVTNKIQINPTPTNDNHLLWIPNIRGLKKLGYQCKVIDSGEVKEVSLMGIEGAGVGTEEAILSAFNRIRLYAS